MRKITYKAGYQYGLKPGEAPYAWMQNYVFSNSIALPEAKAEQLHLVRSEWRDTVERLRAEPGSDIYLCGGGRLAGSLLAAGLVDRLRLKVAPVVFGSGIKAFETENTIGQFKLDSVTDYGNGVLLTEYSKQ